MKLNKYGLRVDLLSDKIENKFKMINELLDTKINLKPESILSNIFVAVSELEQSIENQIAFVLKQFDPDTAEGIYQDALYERRAVSRNSAKPTVFTVQVSGVKDKQVDSEELVLLSEDYSDIFYNVSDFVFNNDGLAVVKMRSFLEAEVQLKDDSLFEIVNCPKYVSGVVKGSIKNIEIGQDAENDLSFRKRFKNLKNDSDMKCTRNSVLNNLSGYTGGLDFLSVEDANSSAGIPSGAVCVIARPVVSDEEFANAVFENLMGGVSFVGDTAVEITLDNGSSYEVKFLKAKNVSVCIQILLKIKSGYYENGVKNRVKTSVLEFLSGKKYGLKSTVYSLELVLPILNTEGVEAVLDIKLKRKGSDKYYSHLNMSASEIPYFAIKNIEVVNNDL